MEQGEEVVSSPSLSCRAMSSSAARDQFLRQMEQIVEGIKQNRIKVAALTDRLDGAALASRATSAHAQ